MTATGIIYIATCTATGRAYVGQTTQPLGVRRQQHEYEALARGSDGCAKFYRALRKHGREAFEWRSLAEGVAVADLDAEEAKHIAAHCAADRGYNICRYGVTTRGIKLSDETRRRMSNAKRPPRTAEHQEKLAASRRGRKLTPAQCKAVGDAKRGITWSPEIVEKRAAKNRGRKRSPLEIARAVASRKANGKKQPPWTPEQRAKIMAKLKGRVFTPEHCRKISEAKRKARGGRHVGDSADRNLRRLYQIERGL